MESRFLITTADERSWAKEKPVIFLGEWCKRFSKKNWQTLDSTTIPYHWDSHQKFNQDYKYLGSVYEKILQSLAKILNDLHGVDRSLRYWRIIVGPWLYYFVQIFYDRWEMINIAISEYKVEETIIFDLKAKDITANDMSDFTEKYQNDIWNHFIYSELIKQNKSVNISYVKISNKKKLNHVSKNPISKNKLINFISDFYKKSEKKDYFFINIPKFEKWYLEIKLRQFPSNFHSPAVSLYDLDSYKRDNVILDIKADNKFESFLFKMIPNQIPAVYFEGYSSLLKEAEKISWPKKPKVILTSSSHIKDDFFKVWAAEKVETGSKLIINQHGGHYGIGKINAHEDHEMKISDYYFSWGWNNKKNDAIKSLSSLQLVSKIKKLNPNSTGKMLLVLCSFPRYSHWMLSFPISSQYISYINDQIKFIECLNKDIQKQVKVRFYMKDYGWDVKSRFQKILNMVEEESPRNKISIKKSINKSRLYVATYNATTFLEVLAANFPTIIFWDPNLFKIREDAKQDFDKLYDVGIFHYNPQSAAKKIEIIWDDIEGWWFNPELQKAKNDFCEKYAKTSISWLEEWKNDLLYISNETNNSKTNN